MRDQVFTPLVDRYLRAPVVVEICVPTMSPPRHSLVPRDRQLGISIFDHVTAQISNHVLVLSGFASTFLEISDLIRAVLSCTGTFQ